MAANGREFSYTRFGEFKVGSQTLSRLRHFQAVCSVVPWRYAKTQAGSSLAWMIACIVGAVVAWLWGGTKIGVTHQVISLYRSCHEKPRTTRIYVIIHLATTKLLNLNSGAAFKWYLCQRLSSYLRIEITPVERVAITSLIALFLGTTCRIWLSGGCISA